MKAYAKINLILKVINKRNDGYHNLQMVNAKIDLYDNIKISINDEGNDTIKATNIENYDESENNLILIVVKAFKKMYNIYKGYDIEIEKHIPFGSGLGGVSMDVGCVLEYIIKDNNVSISKEELIKFVKPYGSDIPYSFYSDYAIVEGVGDNITPIISLNKELLLIIPDIYISTADIFKNNKEYSNSLSHSELKNMIINNQYHNDLQIIATNLYPQLLDIINVISKYGKVVMSGSGSSIILDPYSDIYNTMNIIKENIKNIQIIKVTTKEG